MASIKPKSSLSSFHKILTIKSCNFIHFNKFLSFYLFFIFIFGFYAPNCEATFYYYKYSHYHIPEGKILLRRVQRSPFMPPTVTSFKPAIKKSAVERNKHFENVSATKVHVMPPVVASQSIGSSPPLKKKVPVRRVPHVLHSKPISPVKITFPRPPMVVPFVRKVEPEVNTTRMELTVTPQNDQQTVNPQENEDVEEAQKEIVKPTELRPTSEPKKIDVKPQKSDVRTDVKSFAGLNEVLDALDITIEDLRQVLKRVGIPMETFLDFIDKEKTKNEIMSYLNLPESLKTNFRRANVYPSTVRSPKTIPYSIGVTYDHKYNRVDRQKELVDHLPITEIVHEVPLNSQITFKDPVQQRSQSEKYPPKRSYKKSTDNEFTEKKYKSKRFKPDYSEKNPYLMTSDISTFPSKDSPIATSFWPPKKKTTKPVELARGTASIVSLTIEERITDHRSRILHETTLPIRSKVLHTNSEISTNLPNTQKNWTKSSYEQQQANLRAVFPVRGFIMFGVIFGLFAFVVVAISIILGAVKCNKKPTSSTYELNAHQDQDGSTSSVITNT